MEAQKFTSREYFKALKIVHLALMSGIFFFVVIANVLILQGFDDVATDQIRTVFIYLVPAAILVGALGSNTVFKARLQKCIQEPSLKKKMEMYRSSLVLKLAFIEGPAFLTVIAFLMTGNYLYMLAIALLLFIFWTFRPTKEKAIMELELHHDQRRIVEDEDAYFE